MDEYDGRRFVGIDLHRQRSVIVGQSESGERLSAVRIVNDPALLRVQLELAGVDPEVVLEATYGWYWAVDVLQACGVRVHLAHPLGVKGFRYRRVKNDVRDAADLADLLRMGRLPEAWIAPPATRELRELVRYRAKLVATRSGLKAQIHAVLAKAGVSIAVSDLFGVTGRQQLANVPLGFAYAQRIHSLLELIDTLDAHETRLATMIAKQLDNHRGYQGIQHVPGIGPILAAVFVAEIGDVHRFTDASHLSSWAGLTPRHRESDTVVHRGHITKQGSKAVRWAAIEAVQRHSTTAKIAADKQRIEARRGRNIAKVAAAQTAHAGLLRAARRSYPRARPQTSMNNPGRNRARPPVCLPPKPSAWAPA
jgi:transposase